MLSSIAKIEGLPPEDLGVAQPKDETHAQEESIDEAAGGAGSADDLEKESGDRAGSESEAGQPEGEKAEGGLTEEEKAHWPEEALGRINKLTRQREEWKEKASKAATLEQEVKTLREQAKSAPPIVIQPTPANPLAHVTNPDQFRAEHEHYENLLKFASLNPDGISQIDPETGEPRLTKDGKPLLDRDYSAQDMAEMRYEADRMLREGLPARAEYLAKRSVNDAAAREDYPEMFQKDTPDSRIRETLRANVPELERFQDPDNIVGNYLLGTKVQVIKKALADGKGIPPQLAAFARSLQSALANDGKAVGKSNELEPFLGRKVPKSQSAPVARAGGAAALNGRGTGGAGIEKARERVLEGGGEAAEVDLVSSLRSAQRRDQGAALV